MDGLDSYLSDPNFARLEALSEEELLSELGRRHDLLRARPELGGELAEGAFVTEDLASLADLKALGREVFDEWSAITWRLVCGQEKADSQDRQEILRAFKLADRASIAAAITAALVAMGVAYAIAPLIAWVALKFFLQPGYEATCKVWARHLEKH